MQFYEHKGYVIYPTPRVDLESGCWSIELVIKRYNVVQKYCNGNCFFTKGEAVFHSIQYGIRLIDQGVAAFDDAVQHAAMNS